jgi:hypothetical protein
VLLTIISPIKRLARVFDFTDGTTDGILYFCEDGGNNYGVHAMVAILLQNAGSDLNGETTGLAFSPNGMFMYVAFHSGLLVTSSRLNVLYRWAFIPRFKI